MGEMPCVTSEGLNGISVQSAGKVQRVLGKSRLRSPSNSFEVSSEVGYTRGWVISPFLEEVPARAERRGTYGQQEDDHPRT